MHKQQTRSIRQRKWNLSIDPPLSGVGVGHLNQPVNYGCKTNCEIDIFELNQPVRPCERHENDTQMKTTSYHEVNMPNYNSRSSSSATIHEQIIQIVSDEASVTYALLSDCYMYKLELATTRLEKVGKRKTQCILQK